MALVYLGLGTNLGDKTQNLDNAVHEIELKIGVVLRLSDFKITKPWGYESDNEFMNAVVLVETNFTAFELLDKIQKIEKNIGRTKKTILQYSDRVIDIDILFYDNVILDEPSLKIPHSLLAERLFVLKPMSEIAPDFVHPILGKTMIELLENCQLT